MRSLSYFEPGTCNTIDDISGMKVKMSQVRQQWNGFRTVPELFNYRQPQDFPIIPSPVRTFPGSRTEPPAPMPDPYVPGALE